MSEKSKFLWQGGFDKLVERTHIFDLVFADEVFGKDQDLYLPGAIVPTNLRRAGTLEEEEWLRRHIADEVAIKLGNIALAILRSPFTDEEKAALRKFAATAEQKASDAELAGDAVRAKMKYMAESPFPLPEPLGVLSQDGRANLLGEEIQDTMIFSPADMLTVTRVSQGVGEKEVELRVGLHHDNRYRNGALKRIEKDPALLGFNMSEDEPRIFYSVLDFDPFDILESGLSYPNEHMSRQLAEEYLKMVLGQIEAPVPMGMAVELYPNEGYFSKTESVFHDGGTQIPGKSDKNLRGSDIGLWISDRDAYKEYAERGLIF